MGSKDTTSVTARWTGRVLSALVVLFLVFDGGAKVAKLDPVMKACAELGLPADLVPGLGVLLLACTVLYAIPATAVMGAILLTGYLGGACATHVRLHGPVFPIVFSPLLGVLAWIGLYLREPRLRALAPWRRVGTALEPVEN